MDGPLKVSGQAVYADDVRLPHMLVAKLVRSTRPHARIRKVDVDAALALPGVVDVLTGQDLPTRATFGVLPLTQDEEPLAYEKVRYVGDIVAIVAAEDEATAIDAARRVHVEYEDLPAVLKFTDGLKPARGEKIHPDIGIDDTNVQKYVDQEFGDVDDAFAGASVAVRRAWTFQGVTHAFTEPHAVVAHWTARDRLVLWTATQVPHYVHRALAKVTGLPPHRIQVIRPHVGGGFGGKSDPFPHEMAAALLSMKLDGYSGAAWGYNFDWQSRNFFAPRGTPTIVPTAFAARALIKHGDLQTSRSVCDFILRDLPRPIDTQNEICFSYAPNTNTQIFNASLLAAEVLATVGELTGETDLCDIARRAARYVVNHQRDDGSWFYGTSPKQLWIDNFHTAYILFSLKRIIDVSRFGSQFQTALQLGYEFWKNNFFLAEGWPKYYHDDPYPVDAHAAASAVITFLECAELDRNASSLARNVAAWTIQHLRDSRGFFSYPRRRFYTVRKPYMRWTQAWMLYALARRLEEQN